MATLKIYSSYLVVAFLCLSHFVAFAQNEVARERSSLKGIQAMGFTVTVETNKYLTKSKEVEVTTLQEMGKTTLAEGEITLLSDQEVRRSEDVPFLFLHVNTMDAGQGLVPFAVSLHFYQPVKLILNKDLQTSSITWESETLGLVSYDRLEVISEAANDLIMEFIADYHQINSSN